MEMKIKHNTRSAAIAVVAEVANSEMASKLADAIDNLPYMWVYEREYYNGGVTIKTLYSRRDFKREIFDIDLADIKRTLLC